MRVCESYELDDGIRVSKWGWSPLGRPLMSVLVYGVDDVLFDTGLSHMGKEILAMARRQGVNQVFLTHHHEDHSGNAALMAAELGARVMGHPITIEKMAAPGPILPYQKLIWGRARPVAVHPIPQGWECRLGPMEVIHTPGHARDHVIYYFPEKGIVFSGDLFLAERVKYFRADEGVEAQIQSLKSVLELDFDTLLCAHHPKPKGGKACLQNKLDFLEEFQGQILGLHGKGMGASGIFKQLRFKEDRGVQGLSFGNVSLMNGVRSVIRGANSI